ncbi:MAG TPA: alpha-amylase family glycosyl hydrolase [Caulobacteraceae bacterium]
MAEPWWRGAVIYHVYVRSFFDTDGDGHGDLAGVLAKLDYIKSLGVDGVWLSPLHPSPNRDWGYDVSDYFGIQPEYGTLRDFEALLHAAHEKGLKILMDEVLAHTSDEHPWFVDALTGGDKVDWYIWADPKEDGTAPNNWLSHFGGPAWSYHPARRQHFHHKFLRHQPKLNWRNPYCRTALLELLDFWLAKGIDGFRLDVANDYFHDEALTDNPPVKVADRTDWHWSHAANLQQHHYDANMQDNVVALDAVRQVVERHGERFVFGEFFEDAGRCGGYAASDEGLHAGYSFPLLIAEGLSPQAVRDHYRELSNHPEHWPCIPFSNHDVVRVMTRFGGRGAPRELAPMLMALLLSLRGTTLIYQGEELGLPEANISRKQVRDPVADLYWPIHKGRDGCRTPMPWTPGKHYGFSRSKPWLPAPPEHAGLSVEEQEADPNSALAWTRRLVEIRRQSAALRLGDIVFRDVPEPLLVFTRTHEGETILCAFNMSGDDNALPAEGEALVEVTGPYGYRMSRL